MVDFLMFLDGVLSVALIASIVLQAGKSAGMSGSIAGGAETLLGGKRKGVDEMLAKATFVLGCLFGIVTLIIVRLTH